MIPAERGEVSEQGVVHRSPLPERIHGTLEIDRIPERDGGDHEIQTAGAIPLVLIGAIPNFAEAMKEYGPRERVTRLSFVQATGDAASFRRIREAVTVPCLIEAVRRITASNCCSINLMLRDPPISGARFGQAPGLPGT